ncbi:MAG: S41 family peptidase [Myxococcota bacterium]
MTYVIDSLFPTKCRRSLTKSPTTIALKVKGSSPYMQTGSGYPVADQTPTVRTKAVTPAPDTALLKTPEAVVSQHHRVLINNLVRYAAKLHYSRPPIDDSLSKKVYENFLEQMDPSKQLITTADLHSIEKSGIATFFDDMVHSGQIDPAFVLYNSLIKRDEQYLAFANKHLAEYIDNPTLDAAAPTERPLDPRALDQHWRRRLVSEIAQIAKISTKLGESDAARRARTTDFYKQRLKHLKSTDSAKQSETAANLLLNAILSAMDPHTVYFPPKEFSGFLGLIEQRLEGIGVELQFRYEQDVNGKWVMLPSVSKPIPGGPAEAMGLKKGDTFITARKDDGSTVSFAGLTMQETQDILMGPPGSQASVVLRAGDGSTREVSITRAKIELEGSKAETAIIGVPQPGANRPKRIGIVRLKSFFHEDDSRNANAAVVAAITELLAAGIDALILDLTDNGGGALDDANRIAGQFIKQGPITQERSADGSVHVHKDPDPTMLYGGPLAVLVNRHSASASEIVAAALQDYGRAVIIGERTHGKGTVQSIANAPNVTNTPPGGLKITRGKFYRVNGGTTQLKGVKPDFSLADPKESTDYGERKYPSALPSDTIAAAEYLPTGNVVDILSSPRFRQGSYSIPAPSKKAKSSGEDELATMNASNQTLQERIDGGDEDWLRRAAFIMSDIIQAKRD